MVTSVIENSMLEVNPTISVTVRPPEVVETAGHIFSPDFGHEFVLPSIKYDFNKRQFIARSLFYYV